jgi:LemA protein
VDSAASAAARAVAEAAAPAGDSVAFGKEKSRMKKGLVALVVVLLVVLAMGGCVAGTYNGLVSRKADVENKWAQVDNQLQRRNDLIGNLVETVKGAAGQEQTVFGEIAQARAAMAGAHTPEKGIAAAQTMDGAIGRLLVVVENYPQLKSMESFTQLMDEIAGTENRIATERMRYNDSVKTYDIAVRSFPMNLFAGMFNFKEAPMYPVPSEAKAVPKVDFSGLKPGTAAK